MKQITYQINLVRLINTDGILFKEVKFSTKSRPIKNHKYYYKVIYRWFKRNHPTLFTLDFGYKIDVKFPT
jgi:hypothetical protein